MNMRLSRSAACGILALTCVAASLPGVALGDTDIDAKAQSTVKSLVIVDFTLKNENSSREDSGQGILLNRDGVILIAGALISESLPKEWVTEIKVRLPGKNFESVPATFLGRTRNRAFRVHQDQRPGRRTSI